MRGSILRRIAFRIWGIFLNLPGKVCGSMWIRAALLTCKIFQFIHFKYFMTTHGCFNTNVKPTSAYTICEFIVYVENLLQVSATFWYHLQGGVVRRIWYENSQPVDTYTGCNRRNGPVFGRVFLRSNYTDITQNTYIQSWTVTEILAREVWNFDSYYSLTDYQIHIETGRNMWFL